jgi:hypothetical protein
MKCRQVFFVDVRSVDKKTGTKMTTSKIVFLLTFSSLAIARMIIPSSTRCLIRCFWNSVRFGITADKITTVIVKVSFILTLS